MCKIINKIKKRPVTDITTFLPTDDLVNHIVVGNLVINLICY